MYEGRDRQNWLYVAALEATTASAAGVKNVDVEKLHPYMQGEKMKRLKDIIRRQRELNKNKNNG